MRKLSLWVRAHPMVGDGLIAFLIAGPTPLLALFGLLLNKPAPSTALVVLGLLAAAVLVFRRRYVLASAYAFLGIQLLGGLITPADENSVAVWGGTMIALYTLVNYAGRRHAAIFAVGTIAIDAAVLYFSDSPGVVAFLLVPAWLLGEWSGARRAYHTEVEHRLRLVEFERDQQARLAVAEERNRIAREIHDVLAHSISVMVTQADGATFTLRTKPDLAEQALHAIGSTGRTALDELRTLLGVLRAHDNAPDSKDDTPRATADKLHHLADQIRGLGLPVNLDITGDLDSLPAGIGLGVYRIVQESLTNAVKHGDHTTGAQVRVNNDGQHIEIDITNRITNGPKTDEAFPQGGNGLIGMRERASAYQGTLTAGLQDQHWRVHAILPLT